MGGRDPRDRNAARELAAVPGLSLTVTLRGRNRPARVAWREAIEVKPLGPEDAKRVFLAIAGNKHAKDGNLADLLAALDGVPLAIELMAYAAESEPDLDGVWQRWQSERTDMLTRGKGDHRLTRLGASLELSLRSPRVTDEARRILSLLAAAPDGISVSGLKEVFPTGASAIGSLLQLGLLARDEGHNLRVPPLIRDYVRLEYPPQQAELTYAIGPEQTSTKRTYVEDISGLVKIRPTEKGFSNFE